MQSMILFEFCDIFRCNGIKVENKSVIGILSKDITEDGLHLSVRDPPLLKDAIKDKC